MWMIEFRVCIENNINSSKEGLPTKQVYCILSSELFDIQ